MTLTDLRYATVLANTQHFGLAAEQCNVSQPTLSIAIKKLESELGIEIFERCKNLVYLTPVGKKIIEQSLKVLDMTSAIKDIASTGKDQLYTPLSLGAIFTIGPYLLSNLLSHLKNKAPNLPLVIQESSTESLRRRLLRGNVDVIIVALPFKELDVVVQPLFEEPFMAVFSKDHPLANKDAVSLEKLATEKILLFGDGDCFSEPIKNALKNINNNIINPISLNIDTKVNSLETLCYLVSSKKGITILPQSAIETPTFQATNLSAIPFDGGILKRNVALAWRASFPRHQAIDILRKGILSSKKGS